MSSSDAAVAAAEWLATVTSGDGSGHADLAKATLLQAGWAESAADQQVAEWVARRAWVRNAPVRPSMDRQLYLLTCPTASVVVRAACETCARSVAAATAGAEGTLVWRDAERSTCKRVLEAGKSGVVLRAEVAS